ncbi:alpha-amylase family glycosyl hydrolase [Hyalangium sp.]|uniref:alpha-amylase family glycosyl hydrolase n=1 Tax=Hyalangium sp. TaxID=2028555 RepID=UPI002D56A68D|nr:alpha-amylase family glycosyl hydrolase [Hyalangium sp.]HYI00105.1 alpha-amylase family glycosyl hydrolase [Hyalangium sp.]
MIRSPALCALAVLCGVLAASAAPPPRSSSAAAPGWQLGWARGAVFYEVFVRSFGDSNGDGVGDFNGLTAKLDYLKDLGVEGLWLMPVFESPSYHGYDVVDYEKVDSEYGTQEDFDRLVREAHRRGIRIVLDFVINHTGAGHPWFVESASSPSSPKRNWYVWRQDNPGWTQPWGKGPVWHPKGDAHYYGIFWSGMPDLNYRSPEVRAEVKRLASLWLGRGVDGFRLDAARHMVEKGPGNEQNDTPETHAFWKEFSTHVRSIRPDALLVGEVWSDSKDIFPYYGSTARVAGGDELPMLFYFPLAEAMLDSLLYGDAARLAARLEEVSTSMPKGVLTASFLANHDQMRVASRLEGQEARIRVTPALLLTLPGTPFLYYGEEIGLPNGPKEEGDPGKRRPMPWNDTQTAGFTTGKPWAPLVEGWQQRNVAAQLRDTGSLLHRYRLLIHVRRASPALRLGALRPLPRNEEAPTVVAFLREAGGERVLVVHNLGAAPSSVSHALPAAPAEALFADPEVTAAAEPGKRGMWKLTVPAHSSAVWRLR